MNQFGITLINNTTIIIIIILFLFIFLKLWQQKYYGLLNPYEWSWLSNYDTNYKDEKLMNGAEMLLHEDQKKWLWVRHKQELCSWGYHTNIPGTHPSNTHTKWQDAHTALHAASPPPRAPTLGIRSQAVHCPASPWTRRDTYGDRSGSHWASLTTPSNPLPTKAHMADWPLHTLWSQPTSHYHTHLQLTLLSPSHLMFWFISDIQCKYSWCSTGNSECMFYLTVFNIYNKC